MRKPQRATVQQHILRIGVLNDYVRHLLMLKDSPKAVPTTMKGNIPLSETDLAAILLGGVCPDVVAEPVQPQPLKGSQVNLHVATRP